MENPRNHPVFIFGHGKSGTTLLVSLLDGHPELIVYPVESYFIGRFMLKTQESGQDRKLEKAIEILTQHYHHHSGVFDGLQFDSFIATFKSRLQQSQKRDQDYMSAAMLAYGEVSNLLTPQVKYWVEKTPEYEKYCEDIFSMWSNAKCIHIIRDPRDNYISYKRTRERHHPHKSPATVEWFARRWLASAQLARQNLVRYGSKHYLSIRYEDLVQNPNHQLNRICEFLDIESHNNLYLPTLAGKPWHGNSAHGAHFKSIDSSSIGRWRASLPPKTASVLEMLVENEMKKWDYAPEVPKSLKVRFNTLAIKAKYFLHSSKSHIRKVLSK